MKDVDPLSPNAGTVTIIRERMAALNMDVNGLCDACGYKRGYSGIYNLVNGKHAPSEDVRNKLVKALGGEADDYLQRPLNGPLPPLPKSPSHSVVSPPPMAARQGRVTEPFHLTLLSDGTAKVQVDAVIPLSVALTLQRAVIAVLTAKEGSD